MYEEENDLKSLAREVRYLRDRLDILDCISGYCRGLDRLDADLLTSVYHPDVVDRHGPFVGDRAAFVPWAIDLVRVFPMCHHSVTTHNCQIDGDRANAESYCVFFTTLEDGEKIGAGAARYIDELERRNGKWAISKRVEIMDCCYDLSRSRWLGDSWEEIPARRDRQDLSYQRPLTVPMPLKDGGSD